MSTIVSAHDEDDDTRPNIVDTKEYFLRRKVSVCDMGDVVIFSASKFFVIYNSMPY